MLENVSIFHIKEQCHASAEIALTKRWGMLKGDISKPNKNLRLITEWLDTDADDMPFYAPIDFMVKMTDRIPEKSLPKLSS